MRLRLLNCNKGMRKAAERPPASPQQPRAGRVLFERSDRLSCSSARSQQPALYTQSLA